MPIRKEEWEKALNTYSTHLHVHTPTPTLHSTADSDGTPQGLIGYLSDPLKQWIISQQLAYEEHEDV